MLEAGVHDRDAGLLALLVVRHDAGIGLELRILGAEREDLELAVGQERHAQIVERHDLLDLVGILLGEIHRDVAAHRMADHGDLVVVGVGLELLHFPDGEMDVGDAALNLRQAADIEFAGLGHHRRIGRQVVLRADREIAAPGEYVGQERILGVLDGVAVVEDRDRKFDQARIGLHFLVKANGDIDGDQAVVARGIVECDRLMPDRPLGRGEISDGNQHGE